MDIFPIFDQTNVAITGGTITGITDLAVADGGTGSSTAANARTALGLGTGNSPQFTTLGLNVAAPAATVGFLKLENTTLETTVDFRGIYQNIKKTAGVTDINDDFDGIVNALDYNQSGGVLGYSRAFFNTFGHTDGDIGSGASATSLYLIINEFSLGGDITQSPKVFGNVAGFHNYVAQGFFHEVVGNIYGLYSYIAAGGTVGGTVYGLYLDEGANVDYGIYQNGTAPNVFGGTIGCGAITSTGAVQGTDLIATSQLLAGGITSTSYVWDLTSECVAFYKLDDNAADTHVDDVQENYDGTADANTNTGLHSATKKLGTGSFYWDALADDRFTVAKEVIGQAEFSVAYWEYFTEATIVTNRFHMEDSGDTANFVMFRNQPSSTLYIYVGEVASGNITVGVNAWHFIVVTHDDTETYKVYVDGVLKVTKAGSNFAGLTSGLIVGNRPALDRDFKGYLDNIMIFNTELTLNDVLALYNEGTGTESLSGTLTRDVSGVGTTSVVLPTYLDNNLGNFLVERNLEVRGDAWIGGDLIVSGGLTDTIEFDDGDADTHTVTIVGGIITTWNVV